MALDTYANLKVEIAGWLDRDDELNDYIDSFIDIAESRHRREIRLRSTLIKADLSIASGDRYVALPSDFLDIEYLRVLAPDNAYYDRRYLPDFTQLTVDELTDRSVNEVYRPMNWALHEQIELSAPTDQAYTAEILYYKEMTPLSDSSTSNELLAEAPEAYLYASLSAAAPFLMHDERLALWETLYTTVRDQIRESEIKNRHAGPIVSRVQNIPHKVIR